MGFVMGVLVVWEKGFSLRGFFLFRGFILELEL